MSFKLKKENISYIRVNYNLLEKKIKEGADKCICVPGNKEGTYKVMDIFYKIDLPEEVYSKLLELELMETSFWERLKYLFKK